MSQPQAEEARSIRLIVNGQEMTSTARTLAALLDQLDLAGAAVVAEVNGAVAARENFAQFSLRDGDAVELVRFVGGG